jgi:hypothetical protein
MGNVNLTTHLNPVHQRLRIRRAPTLPWLQDETLQHTDSLTFTFNNIRWRVNNYGAHYVISSSPIRAQEQKYTKEEMWMTNLLKILLLSILVVFRKNACVSTGLTCLSLSMMYVAFRYWLTDWLTDWLTTYLPTYLPTYMEMLLVTSPSQEIARPSWTLKVYHRVHKSPSMIHIMSQIHPVHSSHLIYIRSITILSSHLRMGFQTKILCAFLIFLMRATCPVNLTILDLINLIIFR